MDVLHDTEISRLASVGIRSLNSTTYIKQYGERRTCTNALRAMLMQTFADTFVLMHILGDKHSAPVDLLALYDKCRTSEDPSWEFVTFSTFVRPSQSTTQGAFSQLRFVRAICGSVTAAFHEGRFGIIVCTKHPYAWAQSLLRYLRWPSIVAGSWEERVAVDFLETSCVESSIKHRAWLELYQRFSTRSMIVKSELLRDTPLVVLQQAMSVFKLRPLALDQFSVPTLPALPTPWDYDRIRFGSKDGSDHTSHELALTPRLYDVVRNKIDWSTMQQFGYDRDCSDSAL